MRKPSTRMQISSANLGNVPNGWRVEQEQANVPYIYRHAFDILMHSQLAMLERLDALVELMEHLVVDHVCKDAHGAPKKKDGGDMDTFLKGIGPEDNPTKE